MKLIVSEAEKLQKELIDYRRYLHSHAELGMDLPETSGFVKKKLIEMGYDPVEICPSGLSATAGGIKPGKTVLIRADMDALPLTEQTDLPFKTQGNTMHACGHDMHTTMLLGAAKILKDREHELQGTVKFMFQPAEEGLGGAKKMVEAGILENPSVDMAMMIHVISGLPIPEGMFIIPEAGHFSASSDKFTIRINGKGGHGAMPHMAIDPLIPTSHIHLGLQSINSRETDASENIVVTVGSLRGGSAANIIPDEAVMEGTIRTFNSETRDFIKTRITDIAESIAKAHRCRAGIAFGETGYPSVTVDEQASLSAKAIMTELFGRESLLDVKQILPGGKLMGSEDFSFVTEKVPGLMMMMGAGDSNKEFVYPLHHPKVKFNEDILYKGAAAYAGFAMEWLASQQKGV